MLLVWALSSCLGFSVRVEGGGLRVFLYGKKAQNQASGVWVYVGHRVLS